MTIENFKLPELPENKCRYTIALEQFVMDSSNDYGVPFICKDSVCATDGNALAYINKELITDSFNTGLDAFNSIYNTRVEGLEEKVVKTFNTKELKELILKNTAVVEDPGDVECEECDGSGEVTYMYESKNGRDYYREYDCPICEGSGVIEGKESIPTTRLYSKTSATIKNSSLSAGQLARIVVTAEILESDTIELVHLPEEWLSPVIFKIKELRVLQMPLAKAHDKNFSLGEIIQ